MLDTGAIHLSNPKTVFLIYKYSFWKSLKRFLESWSPFPYPLYWEQSNGAGEMAHQLKEYQLLFQKTHVQLPASTCGSQLTITPVQDSSSLCGRLDACDVCECKPGLILLRGNGVVTVRVLWSETWMQTFWSERSNSERGPSWACVLLF